jgi:hypothetical protein
MSSLQSGHVGVVASRSFHQIHACTRTHTARCEMAIFRSQQSISSHYYICYSGMVERKVLANSTDADGLSVIVNAIMNDNFIATGLLLLAGQLGTIHPPFEKKKGEKETPLVHDLCCVDQSFLWPFLDRGGCERERLSWMQCA